MNLFRLFTPSIIFSSHSPCCSSSMIFYRITPIMEIHPSDFGSFRAFYQDNALPIVFFIYFVKDSTEIG